MVRARKKAARKKAARRFPKKGEPLASWRKPAGRRCGKATAAPPEPGAQRSQALRTRQKHDDVGLRELGIANAVNAAKKREKRPSKFGTQNAALIMCLGVLCDNEAHGKRASKKVESSVIYAEPMPKTVEGRFGEIVAFRPVGAEWGDAEWVILPAHGAKGDPRRTNKHGAPRYVAVPPSVVFSVPETMVQCVKNAFANKDDFWRDPGLTMAPFVNQLFAASREQHVANAARGPNAPMKRAPIPRPKGRKHKDVRARTAERLRAKNKK